MRFTILASAVLASAALFGAASASAGDKPAKAGPLEVYSEDELATVKIGIATQLQYDAVWNDVGTSDEEQTSLTRVRRFQPSLAGRLYDPNLQYKVQLELVPSKSTLMDAFLDYKFADQLSLRSGVHKVAFARYRQYSWKTVSLVDFSNVARYFGTERDVGFTFHNGIKKVKTHEYQVGVYNGVVTRSCCSTGMAKNVTKEPVPEPMLLSPGADPLDDIHPKVAAHYAFNFNGIDTWTETDWKKTGFRMSAGVAASYDFDPVPYRDYRARTALELMAKAYGASFFGAMYTGFYDRRDAGGAPDLDGGARLGMVGFQAQGSYLIGDFLEVAARYGQARSTSELRRDARGVREARIAAAGSDADAVAAIEKQYKSAGDLISDVEIAYGVAVYPFGRHVKLGSDVSHLLRNKDGKPDEEDLRLRFLMQWVL